jgi:hypothetical protein
MVLHGDKAAGRAMRRRSLFLPPPKPDLMTRERQVGSRGERAIPTPENGDPHGSIQRSDAVQGLGIHGINGAILPNGSSSIGFRSSPVMVKSFKCKVFSADHGAPRV